MQIQLLIKITLIILLSTNLFSHDLDNIKKSGVIRHLGVPYANFVTGSGDGFDTELIKGFAKYLGVEYVYVKSSWGTVIGDLTGTNAKNGENAVQLLDKTKIKGDIIANGFTILEWRKEVVSFSSPTFPSGVWLVARADSKLRPIVPTGSQEKDINLVKSMLNKKDVLAMADTCLDPKLYGLYKTGANIILQPTEIKLNELAPAIINNNTETTLLEAPDALIALGKWPGEIKVIGPISDRQDMAIAVRKTSPKLLEAFGSYLNKIKKDGRYSELVKKYYPDIFDYYHDFFMKEIKNET